MHADRPANSSNSHGDHVGPENDAHPLGVNRPFAQVGVGEGQVGRRKAQLNVAAHHFQALSRPNVLLRIEVDHRAAEGGGQRGIVEQFAGAECRCDLGTEPPRTVLCRCPMGLTTPTPVMTMSCLGVMRA